MRQYTRASYTQTAVKMDPETLIALQQQRERLGISVAGLVKLGIKRILSEAARAKSRAEINALIIEANSPPRRRWAA